MSVVICKPSVTFNVTLTSAAKTQNKKNSGVNATVLTILLLLNLEFRLVPDKPHAFSRCEYAELCRASSLVDG